MSVSKKTTKKTEEKKYSTEKLLKSRLAAYQPDFARVILKEPEYTISEAVDALETALKGGR